MSAQGQWICERIRVEADLVLDSPAHFGGAEILGSKRMSIQKHPVDQLPVLTGASIAGAVRHFLKQQTSIGSISNIHQPSADILLFGGEIEGEIWPSRLTIDDATFDQIPKYELRSGLSIDPKTRTSRESALVSLELLPAGTTFQLSFELEIRPEDDRDGLVDTLIVALLGFQTGSVCLGMRKRRGLGRCHVENWRSWQYDFHQIDSLIDWLKNEKPKYSTGSDIRILLERTPDAPKDFRHIDTLTLFMTFAIPGTLLIRSTDQENIIADTRHLHDQAGRPIVSGTTLAGALRHRALMIANLLVPDSADLMINSIFGSREEQQTKTQHASRLWISEGIISDALELFRNRITLDRLTGGVYPGHLFNEQVISGGNISIDLRLEKAQDAEVGLILLLLKDLWQGYLPIGGGIATGRGEMRGIYAKLEFSGLAWEFNQTGVDLVVSGDRELLEKYVKSISIWQDRFENGRTTQILKSPVQSKPKRRVQREQQLLFQKRQSELATKSIRTTAFDLSTRLVVPNNSEHLFCWLAETAEKHTLEWLLVHVAGGVIWGYYHKKELLTSSKIFPAISPSLDIQSIQQLRLFGESGELFVWRQNPLQLTGRLLVETNGQFVKYFDRALPMIGDKILEEKADFTLLTNAGGNIRHAPPLRLANISTLPAFVIVRHYLDYESGIGQAYVSLSRLVSLR